MPEPLTTLERRILDYLVDYLRRNTYQPSIREIGRRFDIKSTKTVAEHLQSLADKGWIERDPARSRGVRLLGVDLTLDCVRVPYHREIGPDGTPARDAEDGFALDRRLAGERGAFFVTMHGDSMEGAGIYDGDLLLVEPLSEEELENGDIIVARLPAGTTVKRYFRRDSERVLEPANPDYPPILVRGASGLVLVGRVSAVLRQLRVPAGEASRRLPDHGAPAT